MFTEFWIKIIFKMFSKNLIFFRLLKFDTMSAYKIAGRVLLPACLFSFAYTF